MEDRRGIALAIVVALVAADCAIWFAVLTGVPPAHASYVALDVGQGDATVVQFAGGGRILTDAGPDAKVVAALERTFRGMPRIIDVAVISHPELDHFNGFHFLLDHGYRIGAFILNGRDRSDSAPWAALMKRIEEKRIPLITVAAGDYIHSGVNRVDILSPDAAFVMSAEYNDTAIVERVVTPEFTALLTGDIGTNVEAHLLKRYGAAALRADILKIGHHGSKYSSRSDFLRAVRPAVATISVGVRNAYGHPARETLLRLQAAGIQAMRTDERGTIALRVERGHLRESL